MVDIEKIKQEVFGILKKEWNWVRSADDLTTQAIDLTIQKTSQEIFKRLKFSNPTENLSLSTKIVNQLIEWEEQKFKKEFFGLAEKGETGVRQNRMSDEAVIPSETERKKG